MGLLSARTSFLLPGLVGSLVPLSLKRMSLRGAEAGNPSALSSSLFFLSADTPPARPLSAPLPPTALLTTRVLGALTFPPSASPSDPGGTCSGRQTDQTVSLTGDRRVEYFRGIKNLIDTFRAA